MRLPFSARLLAGFVLACALPDPLHAQSSRINQSAQALARHLGSTPAAKAYRAEDLATLSKRLIPAIEALEAAYRSNGPVPQSLIEKALGFRQDMGDWERLMVANSVLSAWRDANSMGLFDKHGRFTEIITKGRITGDKCAFELIIPGELLPAASNQLANIRIVRIDERRPKDTPVTPRDTAYRDQLAKLISEKEGRAQLAKVENGPKTNAVGQTEAQALARWEKDMETAGELGLVLPNIRVRGDVAASPSHMTQQRWRVTSEITNLSKHPTEVTVDVWLIGITDQKRDHYVMAKSSQKLKLRPNEARTLEYFTRAEGSYKGKADDHDELSKAERAKSKVRFRGYVIQVNHEKGLAAFAGNDQMLTGYGDPDAEASPLKQLPVF